MARDKVYVIDVSHMIHRAAHTTGDLTTSAGFPTGAIWGTLNIMLNFISKNHPKHLLLCYDSPTGSDLRKAIYPKYKANRERLPELSGEELIIRKIFEMLQMPSIESVSHEADDLIAIAVKDLKDELDIVIVTGDKDMLQLIQPGVQVYDPIKDMLYGEEEALRKFGVRSNQISDYLAIAGDSCDNIPGVRGIGPKGAAELLTQYESLQGIFENLENIKPTLKKKLEDSRELALVSQQLTILNTQIDYMIECSSVKFCPQPNIQIFELFKKLEFKNLGIKVELLWQAYE